MATFDINAVARRAQYTSTGQSAFNFNFQVNATSELKVYVNDVVKAETTHYSASLNADGTGTVTFNSGTTSGEIITIIGDQPLSRTTVFQVGQANNPTTLETEFDNVLIRQQQLQEQLDRSIQLKPTTGRTVTGSEFSTTGPLYFPEPTANKVLSFNSAGTGLEATNTLTDITALAGIASDISTVSGIAANVTTVAGDETDIGVVAGSISSVNTLAGISGLSTLASNSANVTIAATNISSINTAAADITNINNAPTHATNAAASAASAAASASSAAASAGGGTVKVTSADTAPNDLNTKLLVSGNLSKTVGNAGGNETLTLSTIGGAEVYGFTVNATNNLIVTTTNSGADSISATDYAGFNDKLFASVGFTWSINNDGHLIATV